MTTRRVFLPRSPRTIGRSMWPGMWRAGRHDRPRRHPPFAPLLLGAAAGTIAAYGWSYQYYFATERCRLGYAANRHDFNKLIWRIASPRWSFDDATFDRSAASFDNPDHVAIVIHNDRWRQSLVAGEPRLDGLEAKPSRRPILSAPTITLASDFDGPLADGKA